MKIIARHGNCLFGRSLVFLAFGIVEANVRIREEKLQYLSEKKWNGANVVLVTSVCRMSVVIM